MSAQILNSTLRGSFTCNIVLRALTFENIAFEQKKKIWKAYSDHWVSNVVDRVGFLATLDDTLGFVPKVEFNAGVIAAGLF